MVEAESIPGDFMKVCRPLDQALDPDERVYLISGSWEERFFVVAEALTYVVETG